MKKLESDQMELIQGGRLSLCAEQVIGGAVLAAWGMGWTGPGALLAAVGGAMMGAAGGGCFDS